MNEGPEMFMPAARSQGLVVEHLAGETLIYDLERDEAHHLNPTAAAVFALCDGRTPLEAVATRATQHLGQPVNTDTVREAVEGLASLNLLDGDAEMDLGVSRREMVRKAALVGAGAAVAGPVIKSIVAPTPALAQSPGCESAPFDNGCPCTEDAQCATGCCANQADPETGFCVNAENPNLCGGPSVDPR
jgi:hypothetical protein